MSRVLYLLVVITEWITWLFEACKLAKKRLVLNYNTHICIHSELGTLDALVILRAQVVHQTLSCPQRIFIILNTDTATESDVTTHGHVHVVHVSTVSWIAGMKITFLLPSEICQAIEQLGRPSAYTDLTCYSQKHQASGITHNRCG